MFWRSNHQKSKAWLLLCIGLSAAAGASPGQVLVSDAPGVSESWVRRVQKLSVEQLKLVASLPFEMGPLFSKSSPRQCEPDCLSAAASTVPQNSLLLSFKGESKSERIAVEMAFVTTGKIIARTRGELPSEQFEQPLRTLVERVLPPWGLKGFGQLQVKLPPFAVLKVDGRIQTQSSTALSQGTSVDSLNADSSKDVALALGAGTHSVDVVYDDGSAWMQSVTLNEGERRAVDARQLPLVSSRLKAPNSGVSGLRVASYATFTVGAATVAAGLVSGALSKGTASGVRSCGGEVRSCTALSEAQARSEQSQRFASAGNVMLGVGLGLVVTGVAMYVIDVVAP